MLRQESPQERLRALDGSARHKWQRTDTLWVVEVSGQVSFGPTATSKTPFALRPHVLPAWDGAIHKKSRRDGSGESYVKFVKDIHHKIGETERSCASPDFGLADLPTKLGRPADRYPWNRSTLTARFPER